jgi:hypothetical protein
MRVRVTIEILEGTQGDFNRMQSSPVRVFTPSECYLTNGWIGPQYPRISFDVMTRELKMGIGIGMEPRDFNGHPGFQQTPDKKL